MAGRCGCQRACNCCVATSPSITPSGSGSAGSCYSLAVVYSADPGNVARAGTDGGVFADTCVLAPNGAPVAPVAGCVQIPPPVILDYGGGAPIAPNPDGSVSLPASGPPMAFGDGLTTDGLGALIASITGVWPADDLLGDALGGTIDADGSPLFFDSTGALRGLPDHTADSTSGSGTLLAPTLIDIGSTYTSPALTPVLLANPSNSRRMKALVSTVAVVDLQQNVGSRALIYLQQRINGGSWTDTRQISPAEPATGGVGIRTMSALHYLQVLDVNEADSLIVELRVFINKAGAGTDPTVIRIDAGATIVGVTV